VKTLRLSAIATALAFFSRYALPDAAPLLQATIYVPRLLLPWNLVAKGKSIKLADMFAIDDAPDFPIVDIEPESAACILAASCASTSMSAGRRSAGATHCAARRTVFLQAAARRSAMAGGSSTQSARCAT
jgi:hypothetical protein